MFILDLFESDLLEAGAGPARIIQHVQEGTPFVLLSAFSDRLPHNANLKQHDRMKHVLQGLPVSYIQTEGEYTMQGSGERLPEASFFIMPKGGSAAASSDTYSLLIIGQKLMHLFQQQAILYGDGDTVWLIFSSGRKSKLGNRLTFNKEIIDTLEGFTILKGRKFAFVKPKQTPGAATYRQPVPAKKLDKVRQLP